MRKKPCVLFFLCFLLALPAAQFIGAPQLASSTQVVLYENGTVKVSSGQMYELEIKLSTPSQTPYQYVSLPEQVSTDSEGNEYIVVRSSEPRSVFTYSKRIEIKTFARTTPSLPSSYIVPADFSIFTLPTSRTQSDNQQIRSLALSITENASDQFEKVARLAIFVNSHIKYDEALVGQESDALRVLQSGKGVCVEYSTLFSALARAIGIPVRYITGYVYNEKFSGWVGHTWNEVYIGEWVPVDATWLEVGNLDSLHIESGKYAELTHPQTLSTKVLGSPQITWVRHGQDGAEARNIGTVKFDFFYPSNIYSLRAAESTIPSGGNTIVYFSITGYDYRVIPVSLAMCVGETGLLFFGRGEDDTRYVILRPGVNSTVVWEISAQKSANSDFTYTCPLMLNSPYLDHGTVDLTLDPTAEKYLPYTAVLRKTSVAEGAENSVFLTLPFSRQAKNYMVVSNTGVFEKRINSSSDSIDFYSRGKGTLPIYLAGEGGGFHKLTYFSEANSSLKIESFTVPKIAVVGRVSQARATVSSTVYPQELFADFSFDGKTQAVSGLFNSSVQIQFEFVPVADGTFPATFTLKGRNASGSQNQENDVVKVLKQPAISIAGIRTTKAAGGLASDVSFLKTGDPVSPEMELGGKTYRAEGTVRVSLPAGQYTASFSWQDALGNNYSREEGLSIREPGIIDDIAAKAALPESGNGAAGSPCPLAFAILIVTFTAAFVRRD